MFIDNLYQACFIHVHVGLLYFFTRHFYLIYRCPLFVLSFEPKNEFLMQTTSILTLRTFSVLYMWQFIYLNDSVLAESCIVLLMHY